MRHAPGRSRSHAAFVLAVLATLSTPAWADEYTVFTAEGPPTDPVGVTSNVIGGGSDDVTATVDLPFSFPYFGTLFDRISICSNGWAAFGSSTATTSSNPVLPSGAAPNAVVAPLWDDLATGGGVVRTYTNGVAPARTFVIDWSDVESFDGRSSGLRFQIALFEESGVVQFAYGSGGTFSGMSYTAGIEGPAGAVAFSAAGTGNGLSARPSGIVRFEPRATVVSGRVLRDRPVAGADGLGGTVDTALPVAGATVRLVEEVGGGLVAVGSTALDGSFSLVGRGLAGTETLAVEIVTAGAAGRVVDRSGAPYSFRLATSLDAAAAVAVGTVTLDAAVDTVHATIRRALNVQQAMERGRRVATDAVAWGAANLAPGAADSLPALDAVWEPGVTTTGGSFYAPSDGVAPASIVITDGSANPDPYDDDVILREYGHHVLASLSAHPGALPALRDFAATTTPAFAWADGFAYFLAAGVAGRSTFIDTISADTAVVDDLEAPPSGARGEGFPSAVAGSLWDLVDGANEDEDEVAGTLGDAPSSFVDVLAHVDRLLDSVPEGATEFTIRSFFDVWRTTAGGADAAAARAGAARIFIHHGTLPDDAAEPDDRIDEAAQTAGPGSKVTGRRLSPENVDVFRVVVPGPAPQTLEFVLHQITDLDVALELTDEAGGVIVAVTNDGLTGEDHRTLRLRPSLPLPPATYFVRARAVDARTAAYALSIFRPLLLATGDLPEWTAGIAFKQDFVAGGGVEPYTFATSTDAPGLGVVLDGTRLTGVPQTAGEYDVTIVVSDTAAPASSVTTVRPLVINPPPTLPPLFGVAEGRDGSRVLGSGGTATVWTPVLDAPGALTLEGGSDLRLVGNAGAPTSFPLGADALDAAGARLDGAATFVVVTADVFGGDAAVPGDDAFGYFLDALLGSDIDLTLRFRGSDETPTVSDIVNDAGVSLLTGTGAGRTESFGRKVKIRGLRARATERVHVVFTRGDFTGTVRVKAAVRPPRRFIGEAGVIADERIVEVPIDALAGARVTIDLRRSPSPTTLEPTVLDIVDPSGSLLALPTERRRGRKRAVLRFTAQQSGRHVLRLGGRSGTTGPLFYRVRIRTPRAARLVLDRP